MKAQIEGRLIRDPEQFQSRNGNPFATCSITQYMHIGDKDQRTYVRISAFEDALVQQLLECRKGDRIFAQGRLKLKDYVDNEGNPRTALNVTVDLLEIDSTVPVNGKQHVNGNQAPTPSGRRSAEHAQYGGSTQAIEAKNAELQDDDDIPF